MTVFGRRASEYVAFAKACLVILAAVGLVRLGLSAAGAPNAIVRWVSMNVVLWGSALYFGAAVWRSGFGSYRQLVPLIVLLLLVFQGIAVAGILLAIAGVDNIYAAPEYSFQATSQWLHALAHLTIGIVVPTLLLWGAASLVMLVTKKTSARPATA